MIDPLDLQAARIALHLSCIRKDKCLVAAKAAEDELAAAIEKAEAALQDIHAWCAMVDSGNRRVAELQDAFEAEEWGGEGETKYTDSDDVFQ